MSHTPDPIDDQAIAWIIRQRDPQFEDWDAFVAWLDSGPQNAARYHALAADDLDAAEILQTPPRREVLQPPTPRRSWSRRAMAGAGIAAAVVASIGYFARGPAEDLYAVETAPGMRRTVAMPEGTRIVLNGGTRLVMDRNDDRRMRLERGQAVFTVVHDEARPFSVSVGGATLLDVGTVFDVTRDRGVTLVQVAEGAVVYNPDSDGVHIDAGRTLRVEDGSGRKILGRIAPADVATWRAGRLVYDGEAVAQVAADIARSTGADIHVDPRVANRTFRGVIDLGGDRAALMRRVGLLMNVDVEVRRGGWTLTASRP